VIPVGTILIMLATANVPGWQPAEGQCLASSEFPELAEVLHDGKNWPYGKCLGGFKVPDLRTENTPTSDGKPTQYFIKVKP
jgi:Phage Tail Collar Domain